jgi:hypothetical protein
LFTLKLSQKFFFFFSRYPFRSLHHHRNLSSAMANLDPFATPSKSGISVSTLKSQEFRVPASKSFSFAISEFWKPNKEPFLQWIKDLPGPVQHEKPLEPAHYHTLKHTLVGS